jgi:hypothetical protein
MPQITQCPHCRRQLQVRDENLGQTIRCPLCNGLFKIAAPQAPSPPPPPPPPPPPAVEVEVIEPPVPPSPPPPPPPPMPPPAAPKARPSGAARKPVPKPAAKPPQKARPTPAPPPPKDERPRRPKAPPPPAAVEEENPFAPGNGGGTEGGPPAAEEENPFAAGGPLAGALGGGPAAPAVEAGEAKPHRGNMILGLGIAGLVFSLCCFPAGYALGGCATVMGGRDLRLMARRRMDRAGKGPTRTGQILGIVALVLSTINVIVAVWRLLVFINRASA